VGILGHQLKEVCKPSSYRVTPTGIKEYFFICVMYLYKTS
jgi:hypothetical protein